MKKILTSIDFFIEKITWYFLLIFLIGMVLLSAFTILGRLFSLTLVWIDPVIRHFVFYSAFCGGILAVSRGTHIKIDLLPIFFSGRKNNLVLTKIQFYLERFLFLFSGIVLLFLSESSYKFILLEKEFGNEVFLGLQSSQVVSGIMIGFILLAYRFLVRAFITFEKNDQAEIMTAGNH